MADRALRLTVEDDGPGVPPDALEHLFEKFFRVRRRGETSRPGTGIGLGCRSRAHRGDGRHASRPDPAGWVVWPSMSGCRSPRTGGRCG